MHNVWILETRRMIYPYGPPTIQAIYHRLGKALFWRGIPWYRPIKRYRQRRLVYRIIREEFAKNTGTAWMERE